MKKSHILETLNLSTDADSSTDTTVEWTKNTQKPRKIKNWKNNPKLKNWNFHREAWFPPCFVRQNQQKTNFFYAEILDHFPTKMFNSENTSFQHFSPRIPNFKKNWTSDFWKWRQNMPQNLVHEKGTNKQVNNNNTQTSWLLDRIGPVGRFDENYKLIVFPIFGTGMGITKKFSRYLGQERELPKSFPAIRDRNGKPKKVFPLLGNGNSRRFCWKIYRNGNSRSCLA